MSNQEIVNKKNIDALLQIINVEKEKVKVLEQTVAILQNAITATQADLQNTKQLMGHVLGRGMGSTTE